MSKTELVGVRLEPHEKAALATCADAEDRSLSAMARKLLLEALQRTGHLPAARSKRR